MPSVHGYPDGSFKAATSTMATSTTQYKALYLSGDNEVNIINTTTVYGSFIGIAQNYPSAAGGSIAVRTAGPTKALLATASITAGVVAKLDVQTTTTQGYITEGTVKMGDTPTDGVALVLGTCIVGSQAGTSSVVEINLNPYFSSAITTTVAS